jgi:hypothetical protein
LDVERYAFASNAPKKVPPPTPDGREGRLFPPEQSSKICGASNRALPLPQQKFSKNHTAFFRLPREMPKASP